MYDEDITAKKEIASSQLPLSAQEKAIVDLHDAIEELAIRLKPILTPSMNDTPDMGVRGDGDETKAVQSPLASQLSSNNTGIQTAVRKIRRITDRVEC